MNYYMKENDSNNNITCYLKDGRGKFKEYNKNNDELIFEFEYLIGEGNGPFKKYGYFGIIEFEGEYLNDKIWNLNEFKGSLNIKYKLKMEKDSLRNLFIKIIKYMKENI